MGFYDAYFNPSPGSGEVNRKKKGFFLFFEVLGAKFFKLLKANILYFLFSIPYLLFLMFFIAPAVSISLGLDSVINSTENVAYAQVIFYTMITLGLFNFFGAGPISCGYAFVTRCFSRREHTWIWSDGKDKTKENFKSSIILMLMDIVIMLVLVNAVNVYGNLATTSGDGLIFMFLKYFIMVVFIVYMMAHSFIYQILVTYECKLMDAIKASMIMTVAKLPLCALLFVFIIAVLLLISNLGIFMPLVYAVIGLTIMRFPLEFFASRVIAKNIRMQKKKEEKREKE